MKNGPSKEQVFFDQTFIRCNDSYLNVGGTKPFCASIEAHGNRLLVRRDIKYDIDPRVDSLTSTNINDLH